jgi:hypothetical protein
MNTIHAFLALLGLLSTQCAAADVESSAARASDVKDNQELAQLANEDQEDRKPKDAKPIDWQVVGPKDEARRKRVMELYLAGELKTGWDYFRAGLILQHGQSAEDYLLCHELCVAAVFKSGGDQQADWVSPAKQLAAASEDRFLLSIGRAQRFGTQASHLDKIAEGVTDQLRKAWDVPPLAKVKESETKQHNK